MPYESLATSKTQVLIIYLLDVSRSMNELLGGRPRIKIVEEALSQVLFTMVSRSTSGESSIRPRYRIAIYAYSDDVYDILGGVKTIAEIANDEPPDLPTFDNTDTAAAFSAAEDLLKVELPKIHEADDLELRRNPTMPRLNPAPLVCHLTDGRYNTPEDPEPIAKRIMEMGVRDGNVLVENIFFSDVILREPIENIHVWPGIQDDANLFNPYAKKLFAMSSRLPESYRKGLREQGGYGLAENSSLLFPGENPDLVRLGFQLSGATQIIERSQYNESRDRVANHRFF